MDSGNAANTIQFKHFDVVPQASDHHFLQSNTSNKAKETFNQHNNSSVYAKIMKEWKILKRNLPESIFVQAYETRIDLLRAVIIGSPGTPYHDGLFFFDILLPCDYPNKPPKVHYHSHGYRLNPNLYANGKVCLSLLNTWPGSKPERWTKESTLLQILVSIQGLVLNEKPFFNEPGYGGKRNSNSYEWVQKSNKYNEDAFVKSCQTMFHAARNPPENFERFVFQHFQVRKASILAAVMDYQMGRFVVGQFRMNKDGVSSTSLPCSVKVSKKFEDDLELIHSALKKAFAGMSCEPKKTENNADRGKEVVNHTVKSDKEENKWSFKKMWDSTKKLMDK